MNVTDYIEWDKTLNRWDLKSRALLEQADPKIELLIKLVIRSWFIPLRKETKNHDCQMPPLRNTSLHR